MILYYDGYVVEGTVEEIEQFIRRNTPTSVSGGTSGIGVDPTLSGGINNGKRKIIEAYDGYEIEGTAEEIERLIRRNSIETELTLTDRMNDGDRKIIGTYKQGRTPDSILKNAGKNGKVACK